MSFFSSAVSQKTDNFHRLLRAHGDAAYRMALHMTGGKADDAQDLVQEAFIKVWRHWGEESPDSFKSWIYRVMHNLYMDHLRKRRRTAAASLDIVSDDGESPWEQRLAENGPTPFQTAEQTELRQTVAQAIRRLNPDFRVPIVLCDLEGFAYDEIARILGCPIGTVRSRIHRGREQLRRLLGGYGCEIGDAVGVASRRAL